MKEIFVQLATFHVWANQQLTDTILQLDEEIQKRELKSSFPSLYATLLHMLDAESIWWQRLKLQERIVRPSDGYNGSTSELVATLLQQNRQWQEWVQGASEPQLTHAFKYQNSKRESFTQPVYQMLLHLFNHGTYHRGQLVTMLRQLGIDKIPQTDFIIWSRKK